MSTISLNRPGGLRRLMQLAVLLSATLPLAACQTTTPTAAIRVIDTSCSALGPVSYSSRDTPETQAGNRAHNAAWDALCPQGKATVPGDNP